MNLKIRLWSLQPIFGIDYNSISRAYPISELTGFKVFEDELNGKKIVLEYFQEKLLKI